MASLPDYYIPGFHDEELLKQIPTTKLGSTGLTVSKIAFGCGGIAAGVQLNETRDKIISGAEDAIATIQQAIKSGINYIDTAPLYGAGRSELVVGAALKDIPRSSFVIATKVGRTSNCTFDYSASGVTQSVSQSLKKLGLDVIDVIQVHDVEFAPSVDLIINETLPALDRLRKDGKIRFIGVTGYPISVLKQVIERSTIRIDLVLSYCRQTLFDQELQKYLPYFKSKNLAVINAAVHGMGLLCGGKDLNLPDWHPSKSEVREICCQALKLCNENDVDLGKLALYDALQVENVDMTLVGINSKSILKCNLNVLMNGIDSKSQKILAQVKNLMKNIKEPNWEGVELEKVKADVDSFNKFIFQLHSSY